MGSSLLVVDGHKVVVVGLCFMGEASPCPAFQMETLEVATKSKYSVSYNVGSCSKLAAADETFDARLDSFEERLADRRCHWLAPSLEFCEVLCSNGRFRAVSC